MSEFPKVKYHENGSSVVATSAEHAKTLGAGYTDKPNDNTVKALRKASGAAKTDPVPGVLQQAQREDVY